MIPFNNFALRYRQNSRQLDTAVRRVLRSGWYILGQEVERFEEEFARYLGVRHVVGVNSGTDALCLALRALKVGPGDEVITVANTATPTVVAIRMAGALPVFVDIDPRTRNIDPLLLARAVTRRTKAIIPVHLFGYPAAMAEIKAFANKRGIRVLEDAAQATGARYRGKLVGVFGHAAAFSFYPTKNLGAFGDGGAVATNDRHIAESVRRLRNYGEQSKYRNLSEGVNSRLDEMQAAVLRWGLRRLDQGNERRRRLAAAYDEALAGLPLVLPPGTDKDNQPCWHLYVIQAQRRERLQRHLAKEGIQTGVHYPVPIYRQPAYQFLGYSDRDLPVTARAMAEGLSLPLYPELTTRAVHQVADAVRRFYA